MATFAPPALLRGVASSPLLPQLFPPRSPSLALSTRIAAPRRLRIAPGPRRRVPGRHNFPAALPGAPCGRFSRQAGSDSRLVGQDSAVCVPGRMASATAAPPSREAKRVSAALGAPEGYRANVGVCLVNKLNQVLVASRIDRPGAWQMPQGGIDKGEEPQAAARRELREETGVTSAELVAEVPDWLCYDFPPDVRAKLTVAWGKDWQGQAQKWFLFRFTGIDESEISLAGDGTEPPEFEEWKWMDVQEVIDAVRNQLHLGKTLERDAA